MEKTRRKRPAPDFLDFSIEEYQLERTRLFAKEHHVADLQVAAECVLAMLAIETVLAKISSQLDLPISAISYRDVRFKWADGITADPAEQYQISLGGNGGLQLKQLEFNKSTIFGHDKNDRLAFSVQVIFFLVFSTLA